MAAEAPERFGTRAVDGVFDHPTVSRPVHRLTEGNQWRLNSAVTTTAEVKSEGAIHRPPCLGRSTATSSICLPDRLSFTQIERLLSDPLAWTLEKGIGLERGFVSEVPTGNRMIGTFVHAVVERLVRHGEATGITTPTTAEIRTAFDDLAPRFAAERRCRVQAPAQNRSAPRRSGLSHRCSQA
ncbi:PD-(D/E)XK nuclease family protein [Brevibacterium casei]|nr:PD-(D/E)XK nuclease family protein [Brevibacterium casei]